MTETYTVDGKPAYRYVPDVGQRIQLKEWSDYRAIAPAVVVWAWFTVREIGAESLLVEHYNAGDTGKFFNVPINAVSVPIGWEQRYTIHADGDKLADVLKWIAEGRGIAVRFSQYIGDGSVAFQPADNCGQPHWKFGELTDVVTPGQVKDRIRVVKLEQETDIGVPCACRYCNGTGKHRSNDALVSQSDAVETCALCGVHLGFSFTEQWHDRPNEYHLDKPDAYCAHVKPAGHCWVCNGTGKGLRYLSEMGKGKERTRAILAMKAEGWKVGYERRGAYWWRERETVIKDWGFDARAMDARAEGSK